MWLALRSSELAYQPKSYSALGLNRELQSLQTQARGGHGKVWPGGPGFQRGLRVLGRGSHGDIDWPFFRSLWGSVEDRAHWACGASYLSPRQSIVSAALSL